MNGAGFGHGVGMSQYGAYGYAKHGFKYDQILTHYYTGTTIGTTADRSVRVLLRDGARSVSFRGAGSACGAGLKPGKGYVAKRKGPGVVLQSKKGRRIARCGAAMTAAGAPTVTLAGKGTYRGSLEVRASGSSLQAINVVEIEDYVRGVVSKESPASWPLEALKAQAVAARSYGLSTGIRGGSFDLYDDTRSQAYGGVAAETAKTDQAVSSTRLQVVLYAGTSLRRSSSRPPAAIRRTTSSPRSASASPRSPICAGWTIPSRPTRARRTSTGSGSSRLAG